jgi:hypothetical protein
MNPLAQLIVGLGFYLLHTLVLSRHLLPFPYQLIPNNSGLFQSIGWDELAGLITVIAAAAWRPWRHNPKTLPWRIDGTAVPTKSKALVVAAVLGAAHYFSGYLGYLCEYALYGVAALGFPMTLPMHFSLQVPSWRLTTQLPLQVTRLYW